jgi:hypothetical protein
VTADASISRHGPVPGFVTNAVVPAPRLVSPACVSSAASLIEQANTLALMQDFWERQPLSAY